MHITLTAAEAFALKAAAPRNRGLRTIAARITPEQIAAESRGEREQKECNGVGEIDDEEREIRALALVQQIARFTAPGRDIDDDSRALHSLISEACAILGMRPPEPHKPGRDCFYVFNGCAHPQICDAERKCVHRKGALPDPA